MGSSVQNVRALGNLLSGGISAEAGKELALAAAKLFLLKQAIERTEDDAEVGVLAREYSATEERMFQLAESFCCLRGMVVV